LLGEREAAELLEQTLEEEKETDAKLTELAEDINVQAAEGEGAEEEAGESQPRTRKSVSSRKKRAA
jgi:hypothetical protein